LRSERAPFVGVLLAALGAINYGVTVVIGRDLAGAGVGSATALTFRFLIAGIALVILVRIRGARIILTKRLTLSALALGAGYAIQATLFFAALERGTASAVALVFYVYPAMVTVFEILRGHEHPHRVILGSLVLSSVGTAIVISAGGSLSITGGGVGFALGSAAGFAAYLLVGRDITRDADPMAVAGLVAVAAAFANLLRGLVGGGLTSPSGRGLELCAYGVATAAAFSLTFAAMQRAGATRVAVVMTLEAVSAVVFAAIFLGETLTVAQGAGGAAVLAAAVLIARSQPSDVATATTAAPAAGT
jgi:drug/metabolite transporter (DMT)-like permease